MPNLDAALAYLNAGLSPIPVKPRSKGPTLVPWGPYQIRRPTSSEVREWWTTTADANIALVCGNGFLVLDLDGASAEELLSSEGIELPFEAPRVRTGRADSGEHVWLRIPKDLHIRPKVSLLSSGRSSIDIRCDGAMATVPPSIHPSGKPYVWASSWDGSFESIPMAPQSLLDLIARRYGDDSRQVNRMPDDEFVQLLSGVGKGERNHTCARLAGKLLAWGVPPVQTANILDTIWAPRCDPPMPMREVRDVVMSIAKRHAVAIEAKRETTRPLLVRGADLDSMRVSLQCEETKKVVPTPWVRLNALLGGGLKAGEYILLGARPGTGKTAMALQIAWNASRAVPVLFVTLEMSSQALNRRMFSQMTGISGAEFAEGSKSQTALAALERITPEVRRMQIRHSEEAHTVKRVNDAAEMMRDAGTPPGLIVIDYLQLLRSEQTSKFDRRQQVEAISRDLVRLAKVWDCPLLVLSSLTRPQDSYGNKGETIAKDRPPTLASLRESGQLEHDADLVILLSRQSDDDSSTSLQVAKHRDGALGRIVMNFHGATTRFSIDGEHSSGIVDVGTHYEDDDLSF